MQEAAFGAFLTYDRDVWEDDPDTPFRSVYVDRAMLGGPGDGGGRPWRTMMRRLAHVQDYVRILLSGQIGSGKSMELRRLAEEQVIAERFERVSFRLTDRLNVAAPVDMRFLLLAVAAAVAEHIVEHQGTEPRRWGFARKDKLLPVLREWLGVLVEGEELPPPRVEVDAWKLKSALVETTVRIRSDEAVRTKVREQDHFAVTRLRRLVAMLLRHAEDSAGRRVLLMVDDGDKLTTESSAVNVFVQQVDNLLELPCSLVLTFPYWLHFDERFAPTTRRAEVVLTHNVKVIEHDAPTLLLEPAREFFGKLYDGLVEEGSDLVEDGVLDLAALNSAGLPREFVRILQRGFDLSDELEEPRLSLATMDLALATLRRELSAFTQLRQTREAMMRVRLTQRLHRREDWTLLSSLLAVELRNAALWYEINPLAQPQVDRWIAEGVAALSRVHPDLGPETLRELLAENLRDGD